ncbi:MAG: hypothetical protein GY822_23250 [Deltaproteobacteria bacterium]|nr:hypothetical protein [Deltaproteobacteria bacterium]
MRSKAAFYLVLLTACSSVYAAPDGMQSSTTLQSFQSRLKEEPKIKSAVSTKKGEGQEGINGLHARLFVPCSPQDALNLLWDIDRFQSVFPTIQRLEVKKRTPLVLEVEFEIDVKLTWVNYLLRRTLDKKQKKIHWQEIAGRSTRALLKFRHLYLASMIHDGAVDKVKSMPDRVRPACLAEKKRRKAREQAAGSVK